MAPTKTTIAVGGDLDLVAFTVQPMGWHPSPDILEIVSIYEQNIEMMMMMIDLPTVVSTVSEYKNALANVQSYSCACTYGTMTAPVAGALPS